MHLIVPSAQLGPGKRLEVQPGGRLVVGQKLYSLAGDFIVLETLDGEASFVCHQRGGHCRGTLFKFLSCVAALSLLQFGMVVCNELRLTISC